ncbi:MAG: diguanylate cyclase [Streptosporangiaceae bacterium]|jgi:diguanylate cyclase (GGDEF)-like protein
MSDGLARAVLDALPDATAVLDPAGTIVDVNRTWLMFAVDNGGQPDMTGVGVNYLDLCDRSAAAGCEDARRAAGGLRAVLAGRTVHSELEYPCPSPAVNRWFLLRITPIGGELRGAVTSHVNITRRKMAEQELAHRAAHDSLTGLANRSLFADRLKAALTSRRGPATDTQVGLMYLDADRFKQINDTYGHDAGDEVLLTIGHRLRSHVRPQDTVARLSGDEFAVTAPRISRAGLDGLSARVAAALSQPHLIHGNLVAVPVSIGIYLAAPGEPADTALRQADQAMYVAKRRTG